MTKIGLCFKDLGLTSQRAQTRFFPRSQGAHRSTWNGWRPLKLSDLYVFRMNLASRPVLGRTVEKSENVGLRRSGRWAAPFTARNGRSESHRVRLHQHQRWRHG